MLRIIRRYSLLILTIVLLLFTSCENDSNDNTFSGPGDLTIYGFLTTDQGGEVSDARVILHERSTKEKYQTTSDNNGYYSIELEVGSYDICFFHSGYVTYYHGPIEVANSSVEYDKMMLERSSMTNTLLSGNLYLSDGSPAVDYSVVLSSFVADTTETSSGSVTTDSEGYFEMDIRGRVHFDLDITSPEGEFEEFIDVMKMDQPCKVEFVIGSGNVNVHRHHIAASHHSSSMTRNSQVIDTNNSTMPFSWSIESTYVFKNDCYFEGDTTLFGQLCNDNNPMSFCNDGLDPSATTQLNIYISRNGVWLQPYALHIFDYGNNIPILNHAYIGCWSARTYYEYYWQNEGGLFSIDNPVLWTTPGVANTAYVTSFGYSDAWDETTPEIRECNDTNDNWVKLWFISFFPLY